MKDMNEDKTLYIIIAIIITFILIMSYFFGRRDFITFYENDFGEGEYEKKSIALSTRKYSVTFYDKYTFVFSKVGYGLTMKDICDKKDRYFKNICEYYNSDKDIIFTVDNVIINDLNILEINKKYTLYTDTNSYYESKLKQAFKSGNYLIKSYVCDKNGTKEFLDIDCALNPNGKYYFVEYNKQYYFAEKVVKVDENKKEIEDKDTEKLDLYVFKTNNGYGLFDASSQIQKVFNVVKYDKNGKKDSFESLYDRISCNGNDITMCSNNTLIFKKDTKNTSNFGVIYVDPDADAEGKFIVKINLDYGGISYIGNNTYLVKDKESNKYGVVNLDGTVKLDVKYDYVGYNNRIGYVTIRNGKVVVFDNNFNERNRSLEDIYDDLDKGNNNYILLKTVNSYYDNSDSYLTSFNISNSFNRVTDGKTTNDYIRYLKDDLSGEKLVILDSYGVCYNGHSMYVIENNNSTKIDNKSVSIKEKCSVEDI